MWGQTCQNFKPFLGVNFSLLECTVNSFFLTFFSRFFSVILSKKTKSSMKTSLLMFATWNILQNFCKVHQKKNEISDGCWSFHDWQPEKSQNSLTKHKQTVIQSLFHENIYVGKGFTPLNNFLKQIIHFGKPISLENTKKDETRLKWIWNVLLNSQRKYIFTNTYSGKKSAHKSNRFREIDFIKQIDFISFLPF